MKNKKEYNDKNIDKESGDDLLDLVDGEDSEKIHYSSKDDEPEQDSDEDQDLEQEQNLNESKHPGPKMLLDNLDSMNRDQLSQISKKIWGDDYEYQDWMDDDYVRNDVRGSLMDLMESNEEDPFSGEEDQDKATDESEW